MITNFKIFEELEEWNKEIGSYVILTKKGVRSVDIRLRNFLENNIGKITKMYYPGSWFDVKFENTPNVMKKLLDDRQFHQSDILHISKNKKDLVTILHAKKYNL